MAAYTITNTPTGWVITKDGYSVAGRYATENLALLALGFDQCNLLAAATNNGLITDEILGPVLACLIIDSE